MWKQSTEGQDPDPLTTVSTGSPALGTKPAPVFADLTNETQL